MADVDADRDALISHLSALTGIAPHEAEQYLSANRWNLEAAAAEYYISLDEGASQTPRPSMPGAFAEDEEDEDSPDEISSAGAHSGGRMLGGGQPIPTTSSASAAPAKPAQKKFATLGDLIASNSGHAGHGHDDDDDDSDEEQDLFAGGEKSALAVQNPDDLKRKILEEARKNAPRPGGDDAQQPVSRFTGAARTLGGDDAPSRYVPDPAADRPKRPQRVERVLHFWADGFSVDDGPLYNSSDPANARILQTIRSGHAPLDIMNVEHTQEVDVKVQQHDGKYVAPKKKWAPFSGGGQRLGSPTPGIGQPSTDSTRAPPPLAQATSQPVAAVQVDESEPTISLQIRLGDGTRLLSRFNVSHTIGNVYSFVDASNPGSVGRPWVLMTTFPSKELNDKSQVLGDLPDLKRGGVVVQKWH